MTAANTPTTAPEEKVDVKAPWKFRRIDGRMEKPDGFGYVENDDGIDILHVGEYSLSESENVAIGELAASAPTLKRERDELVEAFVGSDPTWPKDIQPLGWLKTLLIMCREPEAFKVLAGDDPDAMFQCLQEVQSIVDHAESVLQRIEARDV